MTGAAQATRLARRGAEALLFIVVTVALAKAGQYAAVDRLGSTFGFAGASLIGAAPVVIGAALLQQRWRRSISVRRHAIR